MTATVADSMPASFYNDLNAAFLHAWQQLEQAMDDHAHAFRIMQVATVAADATPNVRSVVLRRVDTIGRSLQFHTDSRSAKAAELRRQSRVALHAYDSRQKLQLRLYGRAGLHQDDALTCAARETSSDMNRFCDSRQPAPGEPLSDPAAVIQAGAVDEIDFNDDCFMVVSVTIDVLEWLYLHPSGHRRARWHASENDWHGRWLMP